MPDIMEQLEAGKKLQEENGIDVNSLRTKIGSIEENTEEKPKRGRKKKEIKEKESENKEADPFEQAKQIINKSKTQKELNNNQVNKPEKYPGFDFNNYYAKGQKIFYLRIHESLGIKEIVELKIRTVYPKTIIGFREKGHALCIGPETSDMIFNQRKDAVNAYNSINIKTFDERYPKDKLEEDLKIKDMEN